MATMEDMQGLETNAPEPWISEMLTWAEICERYPNEYVVLVDLTLAHGYFARYEPIATARVIGHAPARGQTIDPRWRQAELVEQYACRFPTREPLPQPDIEPADETRDQIPTE